MNRVAIIEALEGARRSAASYRTQELRKARHSIQEQENQQIERLSKQLLEEIKRSYCRSSDQLGQFAPQTNGHIL